MTARMILRMPGPLAAVVVVLLAAALWLAAAGPGFARPEDGEGAKRPVEHTTPPSPVGAAYTVTMNVTTDEGLKDAITAASRLVALQGSPPPTPAGLRRRAEDDAARFEEVMRSRGFYDSDVTVRVEVSAAPYEVSITIAPGDRFTLAAYDIVYVGGPPGVAGAAPTLEQVGIAIGGPAIADNVVAAESRLVRWLNDRGYPFAQVTDRLALANYPDKDIWVQVTVETGPAVTFGELRISGLERSKPELVTRKVDWRAGEIYDQRLVDRLRDELIDTGVFSSVVVMPAGDGSEAEGERPIEVQVVEGPARSISVGASYASDLGFEVDAQWQHRNLFGEGELLSLRTTLGLQRQRLDTLLRNPDFLRRDQDLVIAGNLVNEESDAFDQTGIEGSALLERSFGRYWAGSAGVAGEYFKLSNNIGPDRSMLFGLPVNAMYDSSNDLLNPTRGVRSQLTLTPWAGNADTAIQFFAGDLSASTYLPLDADRRYVVALRGEFGSIVGPALDELPANRRFYAGGGGSVRGYEYQKAGPLNADNDPTGGKSMVLVSTELRLMVTEEIGVVPFLDGGTVYPDTWPDFNDEFFWGTGLGLRYATPVGPVRLDVAVPLERRRGIDDAFQVYISLGQSF